MKKPRFLLIFCFLFLFYDAAFGDYLVVSRRATLKSEPKFSGTILERFTKGEVLLLISMEQDHGYFYAQGINSNTRGYIYRTLVRRYKGDPPQLPDFTNTDSTTLKVDVVDVGPGLCNIITLPDGRCILYDVGHWRGSGKTSYNQIKEIIPPGSSIELMILSHTDSDHIGAASHIIENYQVKEVLHTGYDKKLISGDRTSTYQRFLDAMNNAKYPIIDKNLNAKDSTITVGTTLTFGNARLIFLCGFGTPNPEWGLHERGEKINSVSIVMKLEYQGTSILFAGDAVGRHLTDNDPNALIATEKYLIDNAKDLLRSNIIIAPHHGAKNSSSTAFVEAVKPEKVIFSAGHDYNHPTKNTAQQYLTSLNEKDIFRTDRGDDEREPGKPDFEWSYERISGCKDPYGDDDIRIVIAKKGNYKIFYTKENAACIEN